MTTNFERAFDERPEVYAAWRQLIMAIQAGTLYSQSRFSILDKQLMNEQKLFFTILITSLALLLYFAQVSQRADSMAVYNSIAVLLLAVLLGPAVYFSSNSSQYLMVRVRPFKENDAEPLARLSESVLGRRGKISHHAVEHMRANTDAKTIKHQGRQDVRGDRRARARRISDHPWR